MQKITQVWNAVRDWVKSALLACMCGSVQKPVKRVRKTKKASKKSNRR